MARTIEPVCKLCRREGMKLFLKGERCFTPKCAVERRAYPPGMHGAKRQRRNKSSDYGTQLREKQRARRIYGVLEAQFRRYFQEAARAPGMTGVNLLQLLERRLDNVVYRVGLADSRAQARQLVNHGHVTINGRANDIPSVVVKPGDLVAVSAVSAKKKYFKERSDLLRERRTPEWLQRDDANLSARVLGVPSRDQIDVTLNEQLIVEYYSR
ncbi:MAG: 30S ribosomal protein S4 [Chloroflexi bacterium]|nr:30S ribosomal protein S4 [Chloroflexota bacterium]MBI3732575.1 30S ribosomal protein S4 [Chloroflexota bacterium]